MGRFIRIDAIVIILYIVNPIFGLIVAYLNLLKAKVGKNISYYIYYGILAFYLGFINSTKVPENDLEYHASQYLLAGDFSLIQYLLFIGKEPIFYIFNYFFYYISSGNVILWILVISSLSYFLFFISLHKVHLRVNPKSSYIMFAISMAAFFPQLFSLSAHLLRQFPAGILAFYFFVEKFFYKKNKWWLIVIGTFIHSSTLILFILGLLPFLKARIQKKNILIFITIGVLLLSYQGISSFFLRLFPQLPFFSYILQRASADTQFELGEISMINYLYISLMTISLLFLVFIKKIGNKIEGFDQFANIIFILIIFILSNTHQSELANRFIFYLWTAFPFIIPVLFKKEKYIYVRKVVALCMILFFIYRLGNGTWQYASVPELIFSNVFIYLFNVI